MTTEHDEAIVERVEGTGLPLRGHAIDTDRIMPARFLRAVTFDGLEAHVFEDDRQQQGVSHPFDNPAFRGAAVLIVNEGFGSGSSREHAPQGLRRWGIQAIVGESFSEIFFGNALKLGMPCLTAPAEDVERLMGLVETRPDTRLQIDLRALTVTAGDRTVALTMPPAAQEALLAGTWDATSLLLNDYVAVEETARRLPYVSGAW
jgi:3-isopropylmalate/(R)-2-methylmalate dehydratase small subunit